MEELYTEATSSLGRTQKGPGRALVWPSLVITWEPLLIMAEGWSVGGWRQGKCTMLDYTSGLCLLLPSPSLPSLSHAGFLVSHCCRLLGRSQAGLAQHSQVLGARSPPSTCWLWERLTLLGNEWGTWSLRELSLPLDFCQL